MRLCDGGQPSVCIRGSQLGQSDKQEVVFLRQKLFLLCESLGEAVFASQ